MGSRTPLVGRVGIALAIAACSAPTSPPAAPDPEPVHLGRSQFSGASASSELVDESGAYPAEHAIDGDPATAWCEGVAGLGAGESITLTLARPTDLVMAKIDGGYFKDDRTLTNNGRPRKATLTTDSGFQASVSFPFVPLREHRASRIPVKPVQVEGIGTARTLTLTLDEADAGRFTEDVCISEIALVAR